MTQREDGAAGEPAASQNAAPVPVVDSSPWAPLGQRAFRWLWLGMFIGYIGVWMQTVGAQWLLVDAPNAATLVSLVQAAMTMPVMLLALPGGVLADSFDRRWLLFTVQVYFFVVAIVLTVLTAAGLMPPALLLAPHLRPGHRRGGAAPHVAGNDPRAGAQNAAASGEPTGYGRRQPGPFGRTGAGWFGDSRLRRTGGLRAERLLGDLPRGRLALLASAAGRNRRIDESGSCPRFAPAGATSGTSQSCAAFCSG